MARRRGRCEAVPSEWVSARDPSGGESRFSEGNSLLKALTFDKELTGRTANVTAVGGGPPLNVKVAHFQGVFFNVAPAALHIFAHERAEHGLGIAGAFQRYP